jgi:hypothetical protein
MTSNSSGTAYNIRNNAAKIAPQRQIVASISPSPNQADTTLGEMPTFAEFFAQVSGGEIQAQVEKVYHGGSKWPSIVTAPAEVGDITLTNYAVADTVFIANMQLLRQLVGRIYYDITVKVLNTGIALVGNDRFYGQALLVGLTEPDGDASSGTPATFGLTFMISSVAVPTTA